ncbi:thioredoxin-related transmembrane protein 2 homolog [Sabethes cyaneus]|uniref:thioredoxin-related transmembrane protein 2 homolog n=1 Tax=Sabethes cyaneus TaxID=53552 RepID=UPI00237E28E9|nr:thioredoxin-related transmembrane protein 2 homolog [Sabethes cyaneus]
MSFKKDVVLLIKPYYWVNILMSISYIAAKRAPMICNYLWTYLFNQQDQCELDGRETEILFFLLIVVMIRTRKTGSVTMINYLTSSFTYTKIANLGLWFYSDIRLGLIYGALFILVALTLPEPTYSGPDNVVYLRSENGLDEELERDKRVNWVVTFYTVWNPACANFAPIIAELSAEYSLPNLKFGKVDIGRFPSIGQKYHVSDSSFSRQLPTVILFRNGKEVARRPHADAKGKLVKFFFSADNVKAAFDLNNLYKECKENPIKGPKAIASTTEKKKN